MESNVDTAKKSGSCDSKGQFTACSSKTSGRMLVECFVNTIKTIKIKKTTTDAKSSTVTYSFVGTDPVDVLKDYVISASTSDGIYLIII